MSELFDVFDEGLNHIGVKPRDAVHRDGDWHQVFHCWVIGRDPDGDVFVILQKRAQGKDYPGKVDISAAGHLEAGETVRDGVREIEEELGLAVAFDDLIPLGKRIGVTRIGDFVDCQICHVYFYECDQPLDVYRYPRDEITGLLKLKLDDGLLLLSGEAEHVSACAVGLGASEIEIRRCDFIPSIDNYSLKALILAQRYFAGEKHLWI
ncbi:MAG: NUDIX domain-containing protein [Chloroflexi bacterium]|nr:NUDIX domain-containing protein [Chloroflexota bacterium]